MARRRDLITVLMVLLAAGGARAAEPTPVAARTFRDCPSCPEMVVVPAGSFVMGSLAAVPGEVDDAAELQPVAVRIAHSFALGRTEVTRGEFAEFIRESGYEPRPGCRSWEAALNRFNDSGRRSWLDPGVPAEPAEPFPVNCVSWSDAQAYVQWLSRKTRQHYRLPAEEEWEYAARAGTTTLRPWAMPRRMAAMRPTATI